MNYAMKAKALLVGSCLSCKYIDIDYAMTRVGGVRTYTDKIVCTRCTCPDRFTKETFTDDICKYWSSK